MVPALNVNGTVRNVIFVATQHDSVYAFDADIGPCVPLWQAKLLDTRARRNRGRNACSNGGCCNGFMDIQPEIGVTGTPVIDPATSTLYVVSKSEDLTSTFYQRLHALDLVSGNEKFAGQKRSALRYPEQATEVSVLPAERFPLTKEPAPETGPFPFNGMVYLAWASHEDKTPYHGWLIGYNAATLARVPSQHIAERLLAGIWMAGGAPAFDSAGNLYATTGNGTFDANNDFGDTVLKLSPSLRCRTGSLPSTRTF